MNKIKFNLENNDETNSISDNIKQNHKKLSGNRDYFNKYINTYFKETTKKGFKDAGISDKTLNDLSKAMNDSNNCDEQCRKTRKENDYKEILLLAIQILNGAPEYFDVSQKNFLITKYGKSEYVNYIIKNAKHIIDEFIKNQEKKNENLQKLIKNMIYNYSYNVQYLVNTDNTINNEKNNLSDIDSKINKYINHVNLDERTNFFESKNITNLINYNQYITIFYYFVLFFVLIFHH